MKSILFLIGLLASSISCYAQKDQKANPRFDKFMDKVADSKGVSRPEKIESPHANHFYKTYADFIAVNPVPDVLLSGARKEILGSVSYEVSIGTEIKKMKVSELASTYWGFCNKYGVLFRLYEKDAYMVIIAGNITQYVKSGDCTGTLNNDSTFTLLYGMTGQGGYLDYGSLGTDGEIVNLDVSYSGKSKTLEKMMAAHPEILNTLKNDKEDSNYVKEKYHKRENLTFKIQHYIRKFNSL